MRITTCLRPTRQWAYKIIKTTELSMMTFEYGCAYYSFSFSSSHATYVLNENLFFVPCHKRFSAFSQSLLFCIHESLCPKIYHISAFPFLSQDSHGVSMCCSHAVPMLSPCCTHAVPPHAVYQWFPMLYRYAVF